MGVVPDQRGPRRCSGPVEVETDQTRVPGVGEEGAGGVVLELALLGVVADRHVGTGTHNINEGTAEPRFSTTNWGILLPETPQPFDG